MVPNINQTAFLFSVRSRSWCRAHHSAMTDSYPAPHVLCALTILSSACPCVAVRLALVCWWLHLPVLLAWWKPSRLDGLQWHQRSVAGDAHGRCTAAASNSRHWFWWHLDIVTVFTVFKVPADTPPPFLLQPLASSAPPLNALVYSIQLKYTGLLVYSSKILLIIMQWPWLATKVINTTDYRGKHRWLSHKFKADDKVMMVKCNSGYFSLLAFGTRLPV